MTGHQAHPSAEALAGYAAGDLEHDGATAVSTHLAGCAECAADLAAIERATQAIAALPQVTMPLGVITSIEQALEAERRGTATSAPGADLPPDAPAPVSLAATRQRRRLTLAPFAAAAAVVGLAAAVGLGALRDGGGNGDDSSVTADAEAGRALSASAPLRLQSGTDYTPDALAEQVRSTLAMPQAMALGAAPEAATADSDARSAAGSGTSSYDAAAAGAAALLDGEALDSCLQELSGGPGAVPLLVDAASYAGQPAVVVVLPFRTGKLDVFVVRPECRLGNDALIIFRRIDA